MPHITLTPEKRPLTVLAGKTVLGKTEAALCLQEGSYPPVVYVPRKDIDMRLLVKSSRTTTCPHKGHCSYYSVQTPEGLLENAVWSYETPIASIAAIAGYLAFYPDQIRLS